MKQFIVNHTQVNENATHYITVMNDEVVQNIHTMIGEPKTSQIIALASAGEVFKIISRFCQFVCFIQHDPNLGFTMKLTDFKGNIDNALDEYLRLEGKNWEKSDTIQYVKIANEIKQDENGELAEIVNSAFQIEQ